MNLIFNNQISIFENTLFKYLTPKQCTKLYTSNLILNHIYVENNNFEDYYFTPKTNEELQEAVNVLYGIYCNNVLYRNQKEALLKYNHISFWNTKYITDMSSLFREKVNFNDDISDWNTSNVINMEGMFVYVRYFNQPINNWNINKVKNIQHMFLGTQDFNQDLNKWDIKNIEYMRGIFWYAIKFDNKNISSCKFNNKIRQQSIF